MAIDGFIQFKTPGNGAVDIKGESQDTDYPGSSGWSGVHNVTFGSENAANVATSTGGSGAGKLKFKEFTIKKQVDIASPALFLTECRGGHYGTVLIVCRKTTGSKKPEPFLKYTFAQVKVLGIDITLSEDDEAPMEDIKFSYAAMQVEYNAQDASGKLITPAQVAMWSQTKNTETMSTAA